MPDDVKDSIKSEEPLAAESVKTETVAIEPKTQETQQFEEEPQSQELAPQLVDTQEEGSPEIELSKAQEEMAEKESSEKESSEKESSEKESSPLDAFLKELEALPDTESKLEKTIVLMEEALAQSGTPHFKLFWEARKVCLDLFKLGISPAARVSFWARYSELSKEAKRLKEILDEQSAFAVEQIDKAIQGIEEELSQFAEQSAKMAPIDFPAASATLSEHFEEYNAIQKELNLLNTFASRINALRKELIKTDMRIRFKNKFFQRLSQAGDKVFPRRKELIRDISEKFLSAVNHFIENDFNLRTSTEEIFALREEIKALQSIAKVLTLNTYSFTETRSKLSQCWDQIKLLDRERKKQRQKMKSTYKENLEALQQRIAAFTSSFEQGQCSLAEASVQLGEISKEARERDLGRDEVRLFKDQIAEVRRMVSEKQKQQELEKQHQESEVQRQAKEKVNRVKQQIDDLKKNAAELSLEELVSAREELLKQISTLQLTRLHQQEFERQLRFVLDVIAEKKKQAIMQLSADERQSFDQLNELNELLLERKKRRQEIRQQLEVYRKAGGASGLDFELAMRHNEAISSEKEQLENVNGSIREVEHKIAELKSKIAGS